MPRDGDTMAIRLTYTCRICARSSMATVSQPRPNVTETYCEDCDAFTTHVLGRQHATHGVGVDAE